MKMVSVRRRAVLRTASTLAAVVTAGCGMARAQGVYPSRPVRVIVPFAAGGGLDEFARRFTPLVGGGIGERVVIDNVTVVWDPPCGAGF